MSFELQETIPQLRLWNKEWNNRWCWREWNQASDEAL